MTATTSTSAERTRGPVSRRESGIWLLSGTAAAGAAAVLAVGRHLSAPLHTLGIPWWALLIGFYLSECAVVHVHFRRETHTHSRARPSER